MTNSNKSSHTGGAFATLQRFVRKAAPAERCQMCNAQLPAQHEHLVEPSARKLQCVCGACAILFGSQGETKYRRVPRDIRFLRGFQLTERQWDGLAIPIGLAFFFKSSQTDRVMAFYPSPAGAMESSLPLEAWDEITQANPVLDQMQPDVEALLVNRLNAKPGSDGQNFLVPIDACYRLVGLIRSNWRGLSGGQEVWREIDQFFASLGARSGSRGEATHA